MFRLFKKEVKINTTEIVDEIESAVYAHVKPYGFSKYGRTLHRFVSCDISQVIHFQSGVRGMEGLLCVNVGIRIPECSERIFHAPNEKKYYHEHECTIRSRLGNARRKNDTWYDLSKPSDKTIKNIIEEIDRIILPAFEVLNSREAILARRKDFPWLYAYGAELLDKCMIYGHLGDLEKAKELFELYYRSAVDEYNAQAEKGREFYLKKGERVVYTDQDITAKKSGYITLYSANHAHIDYLDELAIKLGL